MQMLPVGHYSDEELEFQGTYDLYRSYGDFLLHGKQYHKASACYTKALGLKPMPECLVRRAQCQLRMGKAEDALQDAEQSLKENGTFHKGLYHKAEALFFQGEFEQALMYFHRGARIRPESDEFRRGIQKAREAIDNAVGDPERVKLTKQGDLSYFEQFAIEKGGKPSPNRKTHELIATPSEEISSAVKSPSVKKLLNEMYGDCMYLEELLSDPNTKTGPPEIKTLVMDGLQYLNNRSEFWRMVKRNTHPSYKKKGKKVVLNEHYMKGQIEYLGCLQREGRNKEIITRCGKLLDASPAWCADVPRDDTLGELYSFLGEAYQEKGQSQKAIKYFEMDLSLGRELDDKEKQSRALLNLGRLYTATGRYTDAVPVWLDALQLSPCDTDTMWMNHELGHCYHQLGKATEAHQCGCTCLKFAKFLGDRRWQLSALVLIGQALVLDEKFFPALAMFIKAVDLAVAMKDTSSKNAIQGIMKQIRKLMKARGLDGNHPSNEEKRLQFEEVLQVTKEVHKKTDSDEVIKAETINSGSMLALDDTDNDKSMHLPASTATSQDVANLELSQTLPAGGSSGPEGAPPVPPQEESPANRASIPAADETAAFLNTGRDLSIVVQEPSDRSIPHSPTDGTSESAIGKGSSTSDSQSASGSQATSDSQPKAEAQATSDSQSTSGSQATSKSQATSGSRAASDKVTEQFVVGENADGTVAESPPNAEAEPAAPQQQDEHQIDTSKESDSQPTGHVEKSDVPAASPTQKDETQIAEPPQKSESQTAGASQKSEPEIVASGQTEERVVSPPNTGAESVGSRQDSPPQLAVQKSESEMGGSEGGQMVVSPLYSGAESAGSRQESESQLAPRKSESEIGRKESEGQMVVSPLNSGTDIAGSRQASESQVAASSQKSDSEIGGKESEGQMVVSPLNSGAGSRQESETDLGRSREES